MKPQKEYRRIMLGKQSANAEDAINGGFVCAGFLFGMDLTGKFPDEWRKFNEKMRPVWLEQNPGRSKVAAGLACGMLHTICKGMKKGDIIISPTSDGTFHFGEITGDYFYDPTYELPHKRPVRWYDVTIHRHELSQALQNSVGSTGTVSTITKYAEEIEAIIGNDALPKIISNDETIEDPSVFALEKHLEDFLVANWPHTPLGKNYDIFSDGGEIIGQQYPSDTGPIDILAISKDRKELLVVELKKGRASDNVVGQIQRYMGFVLTDLAEEGQSVKGAIIALEEDQRIKQALKVAPNIDFYRYEVRFDLKQVTL
ncbi:MAG: endonuclease NucS domain-containing protein [Hyphomicrobiales bacterium]